MVNKSNQMKLEEHELTDLRNVTAEISQKKIELADCDLKKIAIYSELEVLFNRNKYLSEMLAKKYGEVKINIQTGEINE